MKRITPTERRIIKRPRDYAHDLAAALVREAERLGERGGAGKIIPSGSIVDLIERHVHRIQADCRPTAPELPQAWSACA